MFIFVWLDLSQILRILAAFSLAVLSSLFFANISTQDSIVLALFLYENFEAEARKWRTETSRLLRMVSFYN